MAGCGAALRPGQSRRCSAALTKEEWRGGGGLPAGGAMAILSTALLARWSDDEAVAYRLVSNEMHFFDGHAPTQQAVHKLRVEGIAK